MLTRRTAFATVGVLGVLVTAFLWRAPGDPVLYPPKPGEPQVTIWAIDNGFHTDLVVPRALIEARGGPSAQAARGVAPGPYLALGWGDRRFYVQQGLSFGRILDGARALLWPANPSAVKLAPLPASPDRIWRTGVKPIRLTPQGFEGLARRLDWTFTLRNGAPLELPTPSTDGGRFFESRERFGLLHLCNHWAAQLLNSAGLAMRPALDAAPAGVILDLEADGAVGHTHR